MKEMGEIENKNTSEESCTIKRFTKQQVAEVHNLLEEGKNLDEISKIFQSKYKCKPLPKWRLQKHLTKFYKLKENEKANSEREHKAVENKIHSPQTPINQYHSLPHRDIVYLQPSFPPIANSNQEIERKDDGLISGIPLKFLVFVVIVILLVLTILMRRKERKAKSKPEEPEQQNKSGNLRIKWV